MAVALPNLSHRVALPEWLGDVPAPITAEWADQRYSELIAELTQETPASSIDVVRRLNDLDAVVASVLSRAGLRFRQDTKDEDAAAEYRRLQADVVPVLTRRGIELAQALIDADDFSSVESEFGVQYARLLRRSVEVHDPRNIELRVALSEALMGHTDIFGSATITWRGDTLPISFARKAAHDPDRTERHAAFNSLLDAIRSQEDTLQEIFDTATHLRRSMAANVGRTYTELRYLEMGRFDYGPAEVAGFRDAVERHVVPVARQLREQQAQHLGVERVHPADLEMWPEPAPELVVSVDEQLSTAQQVFSTMGDAFGSPFAEMVREQLIDLPARPGKGNGAFCTHFDDARVPYIFCNSVDSPDDVKTLVHEYGHALQYWRSRDIELVDLRSPSLEACEIHSMTLELLAADQAELFFGDAAPTFRNEALRSTLLSVPYMAAVDEFQHGLYAEDGAPTDAASRGELWASLAARYMPGVDHTADAWYAHHRWLMQLHIFHYPFYYIDYALARMVSWELWLDSLQDAEAAQERYLSLCSAGGTYSFRELLAAHEIGDPFDAATVERTMARLEPHLGL